jgi:hypothetical protein
MIDVEACLCIKILYVGEMLIKMMIPSMHYTNVKKKFSERASKYEFEKNCLHTDKQEESPNRLKC